MTAKIIKTIRWKIRSWFLHHLPSCRELAPVMSQSLDRPLSLRENFQLKLHIIVCVWCERYMKQLRQMRDAVRLRAEIEVNEEIDSSQTLSDEARERLKKALKENAKS